MSTEVRFLLAIGLMLLVIIGTNVLFPPVEQPIPVVPDTATTVVEPGFPSLDTPGAPGDTGAAGEAGQPIAGGEEAREPAVEGVAPAGDTATAEPRIPDREVTVEGPLYRYRLSSRGAELVSAELLEFLSLREGNGPVQLVPRSTHALHKRLVVGRDTLDVGELTFEVSPADGLVLEEGGGPRDLVFTYQHPQLTIELTYTFEPDGYVVGVQGAVTGVDRPLLVTGLGEGLAFNEADSVAELRTMAYVGNHVNEGVDATNLSDVEAPEVVDGPFRWVAFKSKYFVLAVLPGSGEAGQEGFLGGILLTPEPSEARAGVAVTQSVGADGLFHYRLFMGPQEYARLQSLATDLEEVNPYGWKIFRPVIRPIVGVILWILNFLHDTLSIGYGWVLIVFGVAMRVVLWPLNQKAMRAQMRNMAVQPLLKEIQTKYKDNPERLQKEMMRLYKEYGFNPVAGCLPMLLPWPVLIALFFVFQNTIELRGVPFLWLPDLSAKDPFYILPIFLAVSMFALQYISLKSMPQSNPQMKMMVWFMPLFFGFIFMQFPSGLNLYYATANIATIPQQFLIAKERQKAAARGPVKLSEQEP